MILFMKGGGFQMADVPERKRGRHAKISKTENHIGHKESFSNECRRSTDID